MERVSKIVVVVKISAEYGASTGITYSIASETEWWSIDDIIAIAISAIVYCAIEFTMSYTAKNSRIDSREDATIADIRTREIVQEYWTPQPWEGFWFFPQLS